eukprot:2374014-Pyramimonas_sp.AAC.1
MEEEQEGAEDEWSSSSSPPSPSSSSFSSSSSSATCNDRASSTRARSSRRATRPHLLEAVAGNSTAAGSARWLAGCTTHTNESAWELMSNRPRCRADSDSDPSEPTSSLKTWGETQ